MLIKGFDIHVATFPHMMNLDFLRLVGSNVFIDVHVSCSLKCNALLSVTIVRRRFCTKQFSVSEEAF